MQEIYFAVYRENGISGEETVFPIVEITTTDGSVYQLNYDLMPSYHTDSGGSIFRPNFYLDNYFAGGEEITLKPASTFTCHVYPGDEAYKLKLEIREDGHEETRTFYLPDQAKSIESFRMIGETAFSGTLRTLTQEEWNSFSFVQATMPATEAPASQTTAAEIQTIILTEPVTEQPDVQKPPGNTSLLPWLLGGALLLAGAAAAMLYFSRAGKQVNPSEDDAPPPQDQKPPAQPQNQHDTGKEEGDSMNRRTKIDVNSNAGTSRFDNLEHTAKPKKDRNHGKQKCKPDSPNPDDCAIEEATRQVQANFQQVVQSPAPGTSGMGGTTNQGKEMTAEEIAWNTPPLENRTIIAEAENSRNSARKNMPKTNGCSAIEEIEPDQNSCSSEHAPLSQFSGALEAIDGDNSDTFTSAVKQGVQEQSIRRTYYDFMLVDRGLEKSEGSHLASVFCLEGSSLMPNPLMNERVRNKYIRQNLDIVEQYFFIVSYGKSLPARVNPDNINDLTNVKKGTLVLPPEN